MYRRYSAPPIDFSSSTCSGLRTTLTRSMSSSRQIFCSIWPRFEAAAVCTKALWPSSRIVSTMPSTVSGLTKHDAPSVGVVPSCRRRHWATLSRRNWTYMSRPSAATVLPSNAWATSLEPASTTTPAPSLPTGIGWSKRSATIGSSCGGIGALISGLSGVPDDLALLMSAGPKSSPRSDGLMGAASTRRTTSSGPGGGVSMSASESSSRPSLVIVEWSCRAMGLPRHLVVGTGPPGRNRTCAHGLGNHNWGVAKSR